MFNEKPELLIPDDMSTFIDLEAFERRRIYHFGNGVSYTVNSPKALKVSESGGHRLVSCDGICHYVPPKFIAIEIDGQWAAKAEDPAIAESYHHD